MEEKCVCVVCEEERVCVWGGGGVWGRGGGGGVRVGVGGWMCLCGGGGVRVGRGVVEVGGVHVSVMNKCAVFYEHFQGWKQCFEK